MRHLLLLYCLLLVVGGCGQAQRAEALAAKARAEQAMAEAAAARIEADKLRAQLNSSPETAAATPGPTDSLIHEDLDATVWVQTSSEYAAIARQTYLAATARLESAFSDASWSALSQQASQLSAEDAPSLPPAVILDVDETILDNSGFQAELITSQREYTPDVWHAWVRKRKARAIPGAKEFLEACRSKDIATFLVTNREFEVEASTRKNLEALGLISEDAPDRILSKHEKEGWTSDKTSRREFVATTHRVLLLIGDDLNDFSYPGKNHSAADRRDVAEKNRENWGVRWFLLPNPNYGGWERSLYRFNDGLPREEKLKKKHAGMWTSES